MSTTASRTQARRAGPRTPVLVALVALCACAPALHAQQQPAPPPAPAAPEAEPAGRQFWRWLRDEAHKFTELGRGGVFSSPMRYGISPQLARIIHRTAESEGLDPELGFRLVRAESGFNPRARSRAGALGLTQLMPSTARWLDRRMTSREAIMEPEPNLRAGFGYLRRLIDKYGNLNLALLAYNRGEGAVDRDLRRGRDPENGYTRYVLGVGVERYRGDGRRRAAGGRTAGNR